MAIKIYSPPDEIKKPKLDFSNVKLYNKNTEKYLKSIETYCKAHGNGKYKGETVQFSVADGYAVYIVFNSTPMELIHCEIYDEYNFPYIERLKKSDITEQIDFDKQFNKAMRK
jgi:hypothetical protein